MRFQTKLLAIFLPLAALSGVAMILVSQHLVPKILIEEIARISIQEAGDLAADSARELGGGDEAGLLPLLQVKEEHLNGVYAFVLDPSGKVLAHTDVLEQGKLYRDPLSRQALAAERPGSRRTEWAGRPVLDVWAPIRQPAKDSGESYLLSGISPGTEGARLGTVRLGIPLDAPLQTASKISRWTLAVVLASFLASLVVLLFSVRRLLFPLRLLVAATNRIRGGDLGATVPPGTSDEVGDLARSFNRMSEALARTQDQLVQSQKIQAIGRLAGGIAHDFNNLLTGISGNVELLMESPSLEGDEKADLREIGEMTERAAALTGQLMTFSRQTRAEFRNLDVGRIVSGMEKMLRRLMHDNIELRTELARDTLTIRADKRRIEQVLINLVINAADAMADRGRIVITTSMEEIGPRDQGGDPDLSPGRYAAVSVSDTGMGMDDATRCNIFDPFFTTKGVGKGTGLGLAVAYGIIQEHGGGIGVRTEPGRGSTFTVYLPLVPDEPEPESGSEPEPKPAIRGKVLLVEDDPAVRRFASRTLKSMGLEVTETGEPATALRRFEEAGGADVAVVDVRMPEMQGPELVRRLRMRDPGLKVLFITGYPGEGGGGLAELERIAPVLLKPFKKAALVSKIDELLGPRGDGAGSEDPDMMTRRR